VNEDACGLLCLDLPVAEAVREALIGEDQARISAAHAGALADPTRFRIAAALHRADELCVCDLARITGRSAKLVSHHVRVLREAGLAESRREGKVVFYRHTVRGRRLIDAVLDHDGVTA
jgi:DNA-binding transcriptional ArsR family regulator